MKIAMITFPYWGHIGYLLRLGNELKLDNEVIIYCGKKYKREVEKDTWESTENTLKRAIEVNSDIAQFSPYEPCVPDEKKREWLVPDNFVMFKNVMNKDIKGNLCQEEVDYLVDAYSLIYNCIKGELKNNYMNEYAKKKAHIEMISYLQGIETGLKGICCAVRERKWER